jgi:hypothetical protein
VTDEIEQAHEGQGSKDAGKILSHAPGPGVA